MAGQNTELKISLTGDPASLLAALEKSRAGALRTYGSIREGLAGAKSAWDDAQAKVKALADALQSAGPPTKRQQQDFAAAAAAAGKLKDAYIQARDAAQAQQQGLRSNAAAIAATQQALKQSEQIAAAKRVEAAEEQRLAAIVTATRARMAAAAQVQLAAERAAADEAAAAARRQAENQAARIAGQFRVDRFAYRTEPAPQQNKQSNTDAALRVGMQTASNAVAQIRNIAAVAAGVQGVGDLVKIVDAYTAMNARLKLVTRSSQELSAAQQELFAIAQRNGTALNNLVPFYTRVAEPMREAGLTAGEGLRVVEAVSQAMRITGASAMESASALEQFAQALGKGIVNGDELTSVLENAPRLARAVADGLGVPTAKLKEMGEQGALTSVKVLQALRSQMPALNREAAQLPLTIGQAVTNVHSAFQLFIGSADQASGASRRIASAINSVASNMGTVANGAIVAGNAIAVGFAASRLSGFLAAAGGVTAALTSWPALLALVAAAGTAAWLGMGQKSGKAKGDASASLSGMLKEAEGFGERMSEVQRGSAIDGLGEALKKAREQYAGLTAEAAGGELGRRLQQDIARGEAALERLKQRQVEVGAKNLTKERGDLGVDKLRPVDLTLMSKDQADKLLGFEKLYQAFVRNSVNADGDLVTSYQEVRAALDTVIDTTKTPAEFDGLIARLSKALKGTVGGGTAPLRAELTSLIEARAQAEEKALGAQVAGLQARADRATKYFGAMADQARVALQLSTGMARVTAELRDDTAALSADQASQSRTAAAVAQQSANVQLAMLARVAAEKKSIVEADRVASSRVATNARIDAERSAQAQLRALAIEKAGVAPDSQRAREIAAEQKQIALDLAKEKKRIAEAAADAEGNAARRVADVDRATAQTRLEILKQSQSDIASAAKDALANYKSYAQQVIQLDREIVANRLDTASSIEALKRKDMTPAEQANSLREEMDRLKSEEADAARNGDRDQQKQLLARQKSIAGELGNLQGEGIDPKAMRAEAIDNLQRIGDESGAILRAQRVEAAAAAEQQKATFEALTAALQRVSAEIGKINQGEAIKLKAEIDTASVQSAVDAVRQAFANTTFAIRVAATQAPVATGPLDGERRAGGGMMTGPGSDTSDNILTWTSPGEFVVRAAAVRHYGASTLAALNGMHLPRFAGGGLVGGLAVPSPIAERTPEVLQPMTIALPDGRRFDVQARPDVAREMDRHVRMETLKRGRMT